MIVTLLLASAIADDSFAEQEIWSQLNEGRVLALTENDPSEAIDLYMALLKDLPKSTEVYFELNYWLGRAYARNGDYTAARQRIEKTLENDRLKSSAASFLFAMGRWQNRVLSYPYQGNPWVDRLGRPITDSSNHFSAAFSRSSQAKFKMSLSFNAPQNMTLHTVVKGWSGKAHSSQTLVGKGIHTIPLSVDQLELPLTSVDVYAVDSQKQRIEFQIDQLSIK